MNVPTNTLVNRENMILKMIRGLNTAVLKFIMGIRFRSIGATVLGGFAGLSLTANVIPSALSMMGKMETFSARWALGEFAVYSIMAWAVGGWAVQRTGDKKLGAIVLGTVGLLSSLLFIVIGIGTDLNILLTGVGAAVLYGAIGGMIIGDALRDPPADPANPDVSKGRIGDLGFFNYLKK